MAQSPKYTFNYFYFYVKTFLSVMFVEVIELKKTETTICTTLYHHHHKHHHDQHHQRFALTLPAGTDGELSFDLGGVQRVVLCNQEGLEGGSIHKQRNSGELHIEHIVMPLFVTSL